MILKNYTGDRLNFGVALERAKNAGYKVESVVVAECCMSGKQKNPGRRGLCGVILVHKVCAADILVVSFCYTFFSGVKLQINLSQHDFCLKFG